MNQILISIAYTAIRTFVNSYVASGFFDRVVSAVTSLLDEDIPGTEKKKRVQGWLEAEFEMASSIAMNLAIEIVAAKLVLAKK